MPRELDLGAASYPDRIMIADEHNAYTYAESVAFTYRFSSAMRSIGASRGDVAVLLSPNHPLAFLTPLSCARAGIVSIAGNIRSSAEEMLQLSRKMGAKWIFYHSSLETVIQLLAQAPEEFQLICLDAPAHGRPALADWVSAFPDTPDGAIESAGNDIVGLNASGGTTGAPKGAIMSHRSINAMITSFQTVMPCDAPPVHLAAVPITHGAHGLARSFLPLGVTTRLLPKADPEAILAAIEKYRVTMLFLPPTVIYMLLDHPNIRKYDYSSLEYFFYAAAPISAVRLKEAIEIFGPVMCQGYGQAEAPIICTFLSREDHVAALKPDHQHLLMSCGRATPFTEVAIMDDDGALLNRGQTGELVVRGDIVMSGYYNDPDATREVSAFGWHHTGDLGYQDEDGYFYIVDRKKEMIISGGYNIFPADIERALLTHPDIKDCAVIGVPDPKWGEAVKAAVELKRGASFDEMALIAHARSIVGNMKAPKSIEAWGELPRSAAGKVMRRKVRDHYWSEQGRTLSL